MFWDYNLFSPTDKEKIDKTELTTKRNILNNSKLKVYFCEYVLKRWRWNKNSIKYIIIENLKTLKCHIIFVKQFSIISKKCFSKDEKVLKTKNELRY